jgi:hypothetical protein
MTSPKILLASVSDLGSEGRGGLKPLVLLQDRQ